MTDEAILAQMPIDRPVCFSSEKGEPSDKVKARQSGWLLRLWPLLKDKLAKDERILYLAMAGDDQEQGNSATWHLLMFTTAQMLRLPAMLIEGEVLSAINRTLEKLLTPKGHTSIVDVEMLLYGDIQCFEVWSTVNGHLTLRLVNGEHEVYTIKDWGEQHKIRSFLCRYVKECPAR